MNPHRLFLAGDVMTGRGIDQVLPHPCAPQLFEPHVKLASGYVALAERANGPLPMQVGFDYVWGDTLAELHRRRPELRLINLETAVTTSDEAEPKGINYRMNPMNAPAIAAAGIDCCVLANNHVLDWGRDGLVETLETLSRIGTYYVGAGRNAGEAAAPAILPVGDGRVIIFAFALPTSGASRTWEAGKNHPGIRYLPDLAASRLAGIAAQVRAVKRSGDIVISSLHWGGNWGYGIPREHIAFAHGLIEGADTDIVWGHSSHHPKAIEVYNGKLVLYGCGDFLDDYEGIGGYEKYRSDLVLMYLPSVNFADGVLQELVMVPFQVRNFRLNYASRADAEWLANMLDREGGPFGTHVELGDDNSLGLNLNRSGKDTEGRKRQ